MKKYKSFIETILIFLIVFLINFFFDNKNFLYKDTLFNLYFFIILILTLFYGSIISLFSLFIYFLLEYIIYNSLNIQQFLFYFLTFFIVSEFVYYWKRKIKRLEIENDYIKDRLNNIGVSYYLLKLSHDELEKNYILKPFSIRETLKEIKNNIYNNPYEKIMQIMKKLFKIEKASLYLNKNNEFTLTSYINEKIPLDFEDKLLKNTIENNQIYAVNNINDSKYLAVVPILNLKEELKGVFIIKEMPFFQLSKDNLMTISLFLLYLQNLIEKININSKIDIEIATEIEILHKMFKIYNIESYAVIFDINDEVTKLKLQKFIRGSDIYFEYKQKPIVILPLTSSNAVISFLGKIETLIGKIPHKTISLKEYNVKKFESQI